MIANPPPIAIAVNGHSVGAIGVRWRGTNPRATKIPDRWLVGATQSRERHGMSPLAALRDAVASWFEQERLEHRFRRQSRRNPSSGRRPSEVEIYADIERIYATKGRQSTAPGEPFVHDFRHAAAFGRPDGTVVLRGRGGRRLWDHFRA